MITRSHASGRNVIVRGGGGKEKINKKKIKIKTMKNNYISFKYRRFATIAYTLLNTRV